MDIKKIREQSSNNNKSVVYGSICKGDLKDNSKEENKENKEENSKAKTKE